MRRNFLRAAWLLALLGLLSGCSIHDVTAPKKQNTGLNLLFSTRLAVPEPSGLSLGSRGSSLWTVSDQTGHVVQLDLKGKILKELPFAGADLEGVAYDSTRKCLWVVEEENRTVIRLSLQGKEVERRRILEGNDNSGLEGICVDAQGRLFALKEKNPGLFLKLNSDFSLAEKRPIDFAPDFSGICADTAQNSFWVVSDQGRKLFLWIPEIGVQKTFALPFPKAEGLAVDFVRRRAYVVSDSEQKLFVFELPEK